MLNKQEILQSLDVISEVAPIIKSLVIDGSYMLTSKKEEDVMQITKIVQIYSILKKGVDLKGRNLDALSFYLRKGYSKDLKEEMAQQLGIKINNVNQINTSLRSMGYLIVDKHNKTKNTIDPKLQKLVNFIIYQNKKNLIVEFI